MTVLTPAGVSTDSIRRWALRARRRLGVVGRISITIVPPIESKRLNMRYRRKRRPTNVLSFDYAHDSEQRGDSIIDGEVILCPEVIRREAVEQGETYRQRLQFLLEHGLIHLLGLDHGTALEQQQWERQEQRLV